jgi:lon-related putative ATP-dependent protease
MPLEIRPVPICPETAVGESASREPVALPPAALRREFDLSFLGFETTATVQDVKAPVGQIRAADAISLAIDMAREGWNLFVMGPPGSGKRTLVMQSLAQRKPVAERPSDWVYVNNFEAPSKPIALKLPSGQGSKLSRDMAQLVEELRTAIPAVFESDEYRSRESQLESEFTERHEKAFSALAEEAGSQNIALVRTPSGFSLAPTKGTEVMTPDEFGQLPEAEQARIRKTIEALQGKLEQIIRQMIDWRREWRQRLKQLNREMTLFAVGHVAADLKQRYASLPRVVQYLEAVERDVIENADDFRSTAQGPTPSPFGPISPPEPSFARYSVNVIVQHGADGGSPVVDADHPTHSDLIGRIDHQSQLGALVTDFTMIKPGALHRANGGCLLIDARKLLMQPFSWEALKRALLTREIRIESLAEAYSLVSTVSLAPEPIPLDVKVVLFGERMLYYLLAQHDPDFARLFKVVADLDDAFDVTEDNLRGYVQLLATIGRDRKLLPFDRAAVGCLVEHAARVAGDSLKLAASIEMTADLMCEADHRARSARRAYATADDVEKAVKSRRERLDRMHRRLHEAIVRGTLMIDTKASRVGQVNGLSVFEVGDTAFAEPTRITATTRLGEGQVIDVQREVELGGAIHSKGVLILGAFLASRFSHKRPHALAASLVFEQTYGMIEGDSASLAELCALMSSLADVPIRQSLAVTGSINQLGEAQAIGAVNEKIEGFFDLCVDRGLTGEEGVIIPASNVEHLMLEREVVDAVQAGRFHVYAVRTVDEAIELLTGVSSGVLDGTGAYPADSINGRISRRMRELADLRMKLLAAAGSRRSTSRPSSKA